jgi:hypothetical protein
MLYALCFPGACPCFLPCFGDADKILPIYMARLGLDLGRWLVATRVRYAHALLATAVW